MKSNEGTREVLMAGSYISANPVYGINGQTKRYPLMLAVADVDGSSRRGEFICGVFELVDEPYVEADIGWVATPDKGAYHRTEKREI